MSDSGLKGVFFGGCLLAVSRGIFEYIRLMAEYPIATGKPELFMQLIILYWIPVGIGGFFLSALFLRFVSDKTRALTFVPLIYLAFVLAIDLPGVLTNKVPACYQSTGVTPRYESSPEAPDVVLITLDTCRADYLGCYGHPEAYTPTLDRLAKHGLMVEDAITSIPVTTPGHATILTGQNPPEHGSRFNAVPINVESRTLAEVFRDNGYSTGAFISAFPVTAEVSSLNRGFDIYDQLLTPSRLHPLIYRATAVSWLTRFGPFRAAERKWKSVVDSTIKWWQMDRDKPEFTWIHFYDPHFPYKAGDDFNRMYLDKPTIYPQSVFHIAEINEKGITPDSEMIEEFKALYLAEISAVDHATEFLIRERQLRGKLDNCLITVTADHGESLDEHDYYFSHGETLYDPSVKVPLIAWHSRKTPKLNLAGGQLPLMNLYHFILQKTGANIGGDLPVESMLGRIWNGQDKRLPLANSFCESGAGVYTAAHSPSDDRIRKKTRGMRQHGYKVILDDKGNVTVFDLEKDPAESAALAPNDDPSCLTRVGALAEYIQRTESMDRRPVQLPDTEALKKLEMLGYIE